jgi:hypothetical protein
MTGRQVLAALRRGAKSPRGGRDVRIVGGGSTGGDVIAAIPRRDRRPVTIPVIVGAALEESPNRYAYAWQEAVKASAGYDGWEAAEDGRSGTTTVNPLRNGILVPNAGTGLQGSGVDHDGASFPAGFDAVPLAPGVVVPATFWPLPDGTIEAWCSVLPADDGECDALDLPTVVGFAAGRVIAQTSSSATWAAVDKWSAATFIDPAAMSWGATAGELSVQPGTYRVSIRAGITLSSGSTSFAGVRLSANVDGGGWATFGPTLKLDAVALASEPATGSVVGYLTVAGGSTALIRVELSRTSGTGTVSLAAAETLLEAERVA